MSEEMVTKAKQWAAGRIETLRAAADGLEEMCPCMKCDYYRVEAAHLETLLSLGEEIT